MPSVFMSHSWDDKFFVRKLAERLREYGIDVWIDEAELRVGDSLIEKVGNAIQECDYLAAVISHNSVKSSWVQRELAMAMTQEIKGRRVKVLPILIDSAEMPPFLREKLYADFTSPHGFDDALEGLVRAILPEKQGPNRKTPAHREVPVAGLAVSATVEGDGLETFEDIKIVRVDKDQTYQPDPGRSLYHVHFELSTAPPAEWVAIFDAERRFPRHSMWRNAWVEDRYVVVHCPLAEVKAHHAADIATDVASTNAKYREHLHQAATRVARESSRHLQEKAKIDSALDGLQF